MSDAFLPYGQHYIDEEDIAAVADLMRSGAMLTSGPEAAKLEDDLTQEIGAAHAVVCSNGTTALHLAALAAGLGPGDQAIVPTVTFLATANVVRMCGADVIFADVNSETGLMDPEHFQDALDKAEGPVKAVFPVHLNGQTTDMRMLSSIAKASGIKIITDCCHALGASYLESGTESGTGSGTGSGTKPGKPGDGTYEDFACYSMHPVKSIAMGEGGAVTTTDSAAADRMRRLRSHDMHRGCNDWERPDLATGIDGDNPWYYEMREMGYNYRANDLQCVLGRSQLRKLHGFIERRRNLADMYDRHIASHSNRLRPITRSVFSTSAWHLYPVLIDFAALGISRARVMKHLAGVYNIGTQVHYIPVHEQPYYVKRYGRQRLEGARRYYESALSLPIFPAMTEDDVIRVVTALDKTLTP